MGCCVGLRTRRVSMLRPSRQTDATRQHEGAYASSRKTASRFLNEVHTQYRVGKLTEYGLLARVMV